MMHISGIRALRPTKAELALVGVTALWGGTFLVVHLAMEVSGPFFFVGIRFVTAGLLSMLVFRRALRGLTVKELGVGAAIGAAIFVGYGLQTVGLQTIDSSTSAFISALYVPMVPLLGWVVMRRAPKPLTLVGIALAFLGLVLLAGPGATGLTLSPGEWFTLVSAVGIAAEILLISAFAGRVDLGRVTSVQLLVAGVLSLLAMPVVGEAPPAFSWVWVAAAVGLGAASCLIQVTMNWAQNTVPADRATVIYAMEPVWAGVVGRLAGERMPGLAVVGAVLIVAGVLVSELKPRRFRAAVKADPPPVPLVVT